MSRFFQRATGLLLGSRIRSDEAHQRHVPRRLAVPLFTASMVGAVVYVPQFVHSAAAPVGYVSTHVAFIAGLCIVSLVILVARSQFSIMRRYPGGGGDYQVAQHNLGHRAALAVACGFMVDYALTVALCLSMAVTIFSGMAPSITSLSLPLASLFLSCVVIIALRGVQQIAWFTTIPTLLFLLVILSLFVTAMVELAMGNAITAASASYGLTPTASFSRGFTQASAGPIIMMVASWIALAGTALTGIETVNNGMDILPRPGHKNASRLLIVAATITASVFLAIFVLAWISQVAVVDDPLRQLPGSPPGYQQQPLLVQLADAIFRGHPVGVWVTLLASMSILLVAALAVFISFPSLVHHLAKDGFLPHRLSAQGRRLTHDGGIVLLAIMVIAFLVLTRAHPARILPLYAMGTVFAYLMTQIAMFTHHKRHYSVARSAAQLRTSTRGLVLSILSSIVLSCVLVCLIVVMVPRGGWMSVIVMAVLYGILFSIGRHYAKVKKRLTTARWQGITPSRTHALVIVEGLHLPTRRALAYAHAAQPHTLEAIAVNVDDASTRKLVEAWAQSELSLPLKVVESPYRTMTDPIVHYIRRIRASHPRDIVNVYVPELVVQQWWKRIAHNATLDELRHRLVLEPGVSLTAVPFLIDQSEYDFEAHHAQQVDAEVVVVSPETPEGEDGPR